MALEAYSRGANVIACDDNDKRCRILKDLLEAWHVDENLQLINTKAQILIGQQNRSEICIYFDNTEECKSYKDVDSAAQAACDLFR